MAPTQQQHVFIMRCSLSMIRRQSGAGRPGAAQRRRAGTQHFSRHLSAFARMTTTPAPTSFTALPTKLRRKVSRRTVRRRLAENGFVLHKAIRRTDDAKIFAGRTRDHWSTHQQAVGDLKKFTFSPKELTPHYMRLRVSWTYICRWVSA